MNIPGTLQRVRDLLVRPRLSPVAFILVFVVANAVVYQAPLQAYLWRSTDTASVDGWLALLTVEVLLAGFTAIVLGLFALASLRLLQVAASLLFACNALALHFIVSFQVVLSREMMGNVFNTNLAEASDLYSHRLLLWVLCLGVLPALWVWRVEWVHRRRRPTAVMVPAVAAAMAAWSYLNAGTWLWIDDHASRIGALAQPWSYIGNSARYWSEWRRQHAHVTPLPPLVATRPIPPGNKQVVVLVIGEAARAANFSLYGYPRNTNPELSALPVSVLPARSCTTYTTASVECILSAHVDADGRHPPEEYLTSYLLRHGVDVEWRTHNFGEPQMQVADRVRSGDLLETCNTANGAPLSAHDAAQCRELGGKVADGALLLGLEQRIAASTASRVLIVLHQGGSHGPLYADKYPQAFNVFMPVCQSTDLGTCTHESLYDAYDNSIVYDDHVLSSLVRLLDGHAEWRSAMIYVSDHGESLGEGGVYLHGMPNVMSPAVQRDIPFLVWRSASFRADHPGGSPVLDAHTGRTGAPAGAGAVYGQEYVFHSVIGALQLTSDAYDPALDLFAAPP